MRPLWDRVANKIRHSRGCISVRRAVGPLHPVPMQRLGTDYGGWWAPSALLATAPVCLCVGAGEDISFDAALAERFGARVVTVDPTPRAIAHVDAHRPSGNFSFVPVGIAAENDIRRFYAPKNPAHVSHSMLNLQGTGEYFDAECLSPQDLLDRAGVDRVDLVKLDIEGAEHEVVPALLEAGIRPAVLLVEFDQPVAEALVRRTARLILDAGYLAAQVDQLNVTFLLEPEIDSGRHDR